MIEVTRLFVHPVKGCAGVEVSSVELDAFGPRGDRRWMVVDADGTFLSQRSHPHMVLIRPRTRPGGGLELEASGAGAIQVAVPGAGAPRRAVWVWGDEVRAADAGDDAAAWLGAFLGEEVRLVHMPDDVVRPVDPSRAPRPGARVSFADGFPLLLVSEESVTELGRRLVERGELPVPVERFRPNVVVRAGSPHEEDRWSRIRLGGIEVRVVKPCARCAVTTVDVASGQRGEEPLRTLATYRRVPDGGVAFGQNAVHGAEGRVSTGDAVEVLAAAAPTSGSSLAET